MIIHAWHRSYSLLASVLEIALVGRKFLGAWFSLTCMTSLFLLFLVLANVGGMQVLLISNAYNVSFSKSFFCLHFYSIQNLLCLAIYRYWWLDLIINLEVFPLGLLQKICALIWMPNYLISTVLKARLCSLSGFS